MTRDIVERMVEAVIGRKPREGFDDLVFNQHNLIRVSQLRERLRSALSLPKKWKRKRTSSQSRKLVPPEFYSWTFPEWRYHLHFITRHKPTGPYLLFFTTQVLRRISLTASFSFSFLFRLS